MADADTNLEKPEEQEPGDRKPEAGRDGKTRLPGLALHALRVRRGMLRVIFWRLGLWLALEAAIGLINLINTARFFSETDNCDSRCYTWGLPRLFSERLFIPLAFRWYFSVSQKARAWFGAERLPWEGEAARS